MSDIARIAALLPRGSGYGGGLPGSPGGWMQRAKQLPGLMSVRRAPRDFPGGDWMPCPTCGGLGKVPTKRVPNIGVA